MKRIFIPAIIICAILIVSCGNSNSAKKNAESQNDTSRMEMIEGMDSLIPYYDDTYEVEGLKFVTYKASYGDGDYESVARLTLPVPDGDTIIENILHQLLGDEFDLNDIQGYLDSTFVPFEYEDGEGDEYEDLEFSSIWYVNPVIVFDKYIVMETVEGYMDSYMAHHDVLQSCIVFDRTTGEIMTRDDMFKEDADFLKIARKFRESANDELDEFDASNFDNPDAFLINEIFNLGDFYFTNDSLFFVYGPYEINYAYGFDVKMGVSKQWIRPYMNKENYLYKYWFEK